MRMISKLILVAATVLAGVAHAEPVDFKTARSMLFSGKGREVEVFQADFMGPAEIKALEGYAKAFDYYAAFAVSPGDPAEGGSAVGLANFHSEADARAAALAACESKRSTGKPCMILAVVRPKGYAPKALELSAEASDALRKEYRKLSAPKGFAISPSSGAWAMDRGDGGRAISTCNEKSGGKNDCKVVVADQ